MAKYTANYRCGHSETIGLGGTYVSREKELERLKGHDCKECKSVRNIEMAKPLAEVQKMAGLPDLDGTEKQIAWAVKIRETVANSLNSQMDTHIYSRTPKTEAQFALRQEMINRYNRVFAQTSASHWINTRDSYNGLVLSWAREWAAKHMESQNTVTAPNTNNGGIVRG